LVGKGPGHDLKRPTNFHPGVMMKELKKEIMKILAYHGNNQTNLASTAAQELIAENIVNVFDGLYIPGPNDTIYKRLRVPCKFHFRVV
jgi:hypothetical protein